MRQETPDASVGEVAKELGRRWNDVGDDVKSKYEGLAAKDKARYEKVSPARPTCGRRPACPWLTSFARRS